MCPITYDERDLTTSKVARVRRRSRRYPWPHLAGTDRRKDRGPPRLDGDRSRAQAPAPRLGMSSGRRLFPASTVTILSIPIIRLGRRTLQRCSTSALTSTGQACSTRGDLGTVTVLMVKYRPSCDSSARKCIADFTFGSLVLRYMSLQICARLQGSNVVVGSVIAGDVPATARCIEAVGDARGRRRRHPGPRSRDSIARRPGAAEWAHELSITLNTERAPIQTSWRARTMERGNEIASIDTIILSRQLVQGTSHGAQNLTFETTP